LYSTQIFFLCRTLYIYIYIYIYICNNAYVPKLLIVFFLRWWKEKSACVNSYIFRIYIYILISDWEHFGPIIKLQYLAQQITHYFGSLFPISSPDGTTTSLATYPHCMRATCAQFQLTDVAVHAGHVYYFLFKLLTSVPLHEFLPL
jgi:hypothetical protein